MKTVPGMVDAFGADVLEGMKKPEKNVFLALDPMGLAMSGVIAAVAKRIAALIVDALPVDPAQAIDGASLFENMDAIANTVRLVVDTRPPALGPVCPQHTAAGHDDADCPSGQQDCPGPGFSVQMALLAALLRSISPGSVSVTRGFTCAMGGLMAGGGIIETIKRVLPLRDRQVQVQRTTKTQFAAGTAQGDQTLYDALLSRVQVLALHPDPIKATRIDSQDQGKFVGYRHDRLRSLDELVTQIEVTVNRQKAGGASMAMEAARQTMMEDPDWDSPRGSAYAYICSD